MYNIAVTIAVLIAAFCIMYAISEGKTLKEEYDEWSTQKNRAKFRAPAYKQMNKRWAQRHNRDELWRRLTR